MDSNDRGLPKRLLTPQEAAEFLAISTRQLRVLTTDGSIRYVNIGRLDRETRRYDLACYSSRAALTARPRQRRHPSVNLIPRQHVMLRVIRSGRG